MVSLKTFSTYLPTKTKVHADMSVRNISNIVDKNSGRDLNKLFYYYL